MLIGTAHTAVCVPDVEAAVEWYEQILGLKVLSPPYEMSGPAIEKDMGELIPSPVVVKAAIVGVEASDHVIEVIEYPSAPAGGEPGSRPLTDFGLTHVGLVCDNVEGTRRGLEARGVKFLTGGIANVAGLETTWFCDPWGNVFILLGKRDPTRPYWQQYGPPPTR